MSKKIDVENPNDNPEALKIFPRNLTARAAYVVKGNPVSSRPESGVDNCFPGLEFDQRNLEEKFFPGLTFYYHRGDGARLIDIEFEAELVANGIAESEIIDADRPFYLWALHGRTLVEVPEASFFSFRNLEGMEVWRRVHELMPGSVALLIGPKPPFFATVDGIIRSLSSKVTDAYKDFSESHDDPTIPSDPLFIPVRGQDGKLVAIVLAGNRARYLNEAGVIEVDSYSPGELTKTMCAPWMYDFRDCYCFYWSANKPDIVDSSDGDRKYLNFIRGTDNRGPEPQADVDYYRLESGQERRDLELTYENLVEGWWNELPVVLNDSESLTGATVQPPPNPFPGEFLSRKELVAELKYLATVEHALTVQYLYAHYSVDAPSVQPADNDPRAKHFAATREVFSIAVDEMRHFLWVNMALRQLGESPVIGRAKTIGAPPTSSDGRKHFTDKPKNYLAKPYALAPLTQAQLDWFISVEENSTTANVGLDGMYVEILQTLAEFPQDYPNPERLMQLIKLIIDEGDDHWSRFKSIKSTLKGIPENIYLRTLASTPSDVDERFLSVCDLYYESLLSSLDVAFQMEPERGNQLTQAAIRSMHNLHETAYVLAERGVLPKFHLPSVQSAVAAAPTIKKSDRKAAKDVVDALASHRDRMHGILQEIRSTGDGENARFATRHAKNVSDFFETARNLIDSY